MPIKIGFFICHCGVNIASKVRVEEVATFVRGLKNVVVSRDYKFMCSDPGQEMIVNDIQEYGLNRVVVASCSPRLHEKTFQTACQRAGINPYFFQMASVREQVSWVTEDENEATRKAKTMAAAAINRVNYHQSLAAREVKVHPDVLVVGAGITGMQSALDIAESGHKVYLVERQPTIGGHMLQFDKTFPTLDCAACIGTPKMVSVGQHSNINLLTYSEVAEVSGFIGNYKVKVIRKPRYVKEGVCTGCGDCVEVCPVIRPSEWDEGLGTRKAIYRSFPQAVPITFAIEKMDRAPCVITCPAGINVQGYIQLIGQGKYEEALKLIMERLPLPGVLGRVCPHPCEASCRRMEVDESLTIRELKRFVADQVKLEDLPLPKIEDRPEKVAVVGSGPAGLTVAYYLRLKGYRVTIFEALPVLGGMLRVGIPDYRLPPEIVEKEIDYILKLGIEVQNGKSLGTDFTLDDLENQDFKAIFLGIGAHSSLKLNIPGEDKFEGLLDAVDFLREMNLGSRKLPGKKIVIIGGGNVAIDAARSALRLGSEEVTIVYRRSREEMPAYPEEINDALAEGVKIHYLTAPVGIRGSNGKVTGFECIKTELGSPDASGRPRPVPVEGSEFLIDCDAIIPAIGQRPDLAWVADKPGLETSRWNTIIVNRHTMQTSVPHVFASGDAVTGPATVIEAVSSGHKATEAIHRYLNGEDLEVYANELAALEPPGQDWLEIPKGLSRETRATTAHRDTQESVSSFDEVNLGFSEEEAKKEAQRCLNCGGCCECMECIRACEANAINHNMDQEELEIDVGSIILSTGYDLMDPTPMRQFGYGTYPNVFTSLEFERLNNATGPTSGEILLKDEKGKFTKPPESVAIIHCVGSRDVNYHEYCSRVCCMYALKYGHLIKDKVGEDTAIYNFYIDMRCFGKGYEEFLTRVQSEGVKLIRGKAARVTDKAEDPEEVGKLITIAEDTLSNKVMRVPVDMVILCAAMEARDDALDVGRVFGVNQGADGFFLEEHPKLGPLSTATDGVFLAGACQGPKDIPDAVAQASGAAVKALSLATLGRVEISPTISWIDPEVCAGCKTCIDLCAYSAIEFDERRGVSVVNEALCKGCGSCSGFCPSGAAQIKHFNEKQVFAELDGIMDAIAAVGI
ncbi:MAG: NAD(P)-binding protein [Thermodesulfobacteriota bacterium]|nr:NAD(P)-binding protein [Thermodesulfobacteriota bacterium]